jgi:hypothetical protein
MRRLIEPGTTRGEPCSAMRASVSGSGQASQRPNCGGPPLKRKRRRWAAPAHGSGNTAGPTPLPSVSRCSVVPTSGRVPPCQHPPSPGCCSRRARSSWALVMVARACHDAPGGQLISRPCRRLCHDAPRAWRRDHPRGDRVPGRRGGRTRAAGRVGDEVAPQRHRRERTATLLTSGERGSRMERPRDTLRDDDPFASQSALRRAADHAVRFLADPTRAAGSDPPRSVRCSWGRSPVRG